MASPDFGLNSSKIPASQVPSVVGSLQVSQLSLGLALVILAASASTGSQLPFDSPKLVLSVLRILITFSLRHMTKSQSLEIIQYDHGIMTKQPRSLLKNKTIPLEWRLLTSSNVGPVISFISNYFEFFLKGNWVYW